MNRRNIAVFDNGGETLDRYTIIDRKTGDVYNCSHDPFHPNGVALFNYNIADAYWGVAYGYSWRKHLAVTNAIKNSVSNYMQDTKHLGSRVRLNKVPIEVLKYIDKINLVDNN